MLTRPILDILKNEELTLDEVTSMNSMQLSLNTSLTSLSARDPSAQKLFALLGLLPGGAKAMDFDAIWGKGWIT